MEITETPTRVQRKRTKGWRMGDAVYVGRGSKWGNQITFRRVPGGKYEICEIYQGELISEGLPLADSAEEARRRVVDFYTGLMDNAMPQTHAKIKAELAGKNLACWCPLADAQGNHVPCHADVLLEIANQKEKDNR